MIKNQLAGTLCCIFFLGGVDFLGGKGQSIFSLINRADLSSDLERTC